MMMIKKALTLSQVSEKIKVKTKVTKIVTSNVLEREWQVSKSLYQRVGESHGIHTEKKWVINSMLEEEKERKGDRDWGKRWHFESIRIERSKKERKKERKIKTVRE